MSPHDPYGIAAVTAERDSLAAELARLKDQLQECATTMVRQAELSVWQHQEFNRTRAKLEFVMKSAADLVKVLSVHQGHVALTGQLAMLHRAMTIDIGVGLLLPYELQSVECELDRRRIDMEKFVKLRKGIETLLGPHVEELRALVALLDQS